MRNWLNRSVSDTQITVRQRLWLYVFSTIIMIPSSNFNNYTATRCANKVGECIVLQHSIVVHIDIYVVTEGSDKIMSHSYVVPSVIVHVNTTGCSAITSSLTNLHFIRVT